MIGFRKFRKRLNQCDDVVMVEYVLYINNDAERTFKQESDLITFVSDYMKMNEVFYINVFVHTVKQLIIN